MQCMVIRITTCAGCVYMEYNIINICYIYRPTALHVYYRIYSICVCMHLCVHKILLMSVYLYMYVRVQGHGL